MVASRTIYEWNHFPKLSEFNRLDSRTGGYSTDLYLYKLIKSSHGAVITALENEIEDLKTKCSDLEARIAALESP